MYLKKPTANFILNGEGQNHFPQIRAKARMSAYSTQHGSFSHSNKEEKKSNVPISQINK